MAAFNPICLTNFLFIEIFEIKQKFERDAERCLPGSFGGRSDTRRQRLKDASIRAMVLLGTVAALEVDHMNGWRTLASSHTLTVGDLSVVIHNGVISSRYTADRITTRLRWLLENADEILLDHSFTATTIA